MSDATDSLLATVRAFGDDSLRDVWLFDQWTHERLFVRDDVAERLADVDVKGFVDNERYGYVTRDTYEAIWYSEYRYTVRGFESFELQILEELRGVVDLGAANFREGLSAKLHRSALGPEPAALATRAGLVAHEFTEEVAHALFGRGVVGPGDESRRAVVAAPFDAIVVAAGGPSVPEALKGQLKDGGRLVIPVGEASLGQSLRRITRKGPALLDLQGYGPLLLEGFKLTVLVGVASMALAILLGIVGAWAKVTQLRAVNWAAGVYTTVVRGVPELVLILLVYYGVPTLIQDAATGLGYDIRVDLNPFLSGVLTIGFIYGAFSTEVFRGAYLAVPAGQMEAARACGMTRLMAARRILLPQMWRYAIPGLGNVWMVLIKATALISVIELQELMRAAQVAAQATRLPFTFYAAAAGLYLVLTIVSMLLQQRLETWANRGVQRA